VSRIPGKDSRKGALYGHLHREVGRARTPATDGASRGGAQGLVERLPADAELEVAASTSPALGPGISGNGRAPIVVAVSPGSSDDEVVAAGADLAQALGYPLEILHVVETDVAMDQVVETEDESAAAAALARRVEQLSRQGIAVTGHLVEVVGDHGDVGQRIATFANRHRAAMVVLGPPSHGRYAGLLDASATEEVARRVHCDLHIVRSSPTPTPTTRTSPTR